MEKDRQLPIGMVLAKEPKSNRRTFALQRSVLEALGEIADAEETNVNALVNDILLDFVLDYYRKRI